MADLYGPIKSLIANLDNFDNRLVAAGDKDRAERLVRLRVRVSLLLGGDLRKGTVAHVAKVTAFAARAAALEGDDSAAAEALIGELDPFVAEIAKLVKRPADTGV